MAFQPNIEGIRIKGTLSGITYIESTTISASTYLGISTTDTYVTGGTFSSNTLTLDRNDGGSVVVTGFTSDNFYVTGFTYNDANTFTISRNGGLGDLTSTINNMTGLTVNGNIDVIGDINVTGTTYYTNITGTSIGVDYIDFNNALTPLPTDQEGRIYWDEDNGTLSLGMHGGQVVQQVGLEQYYYVKNQSGATIENGRVVRAAGTLGSSGRILGEYMIADGTIPPKFTLGIATEDIVNGDDGYVTEFGLVRGVNTTGSLYGESWSGGTILWVSPTIPGGLTSVEPQAPNLKIEMAIVINAASNGSMFVRPNRYPYLYDLQQINYSAGTENNLDILQWNSSNLTWDKTNTPSFNSVSATTISGGSLTINGDATINGDIEMGNTSTRQIFSTGVSEISSIQYATSGTSIQMRWDGSGDSTVLSVNNTDFITASSTKSLFGGISYGADYSANYDDRSLIDLGYFNSNDRYVTGFTYNDNNTFTLTRSSGLSDLTSTINTMSGLTINGNLDVNGNTEISGTLNIGTLGTGTSVNNLGLDINGNVVSGNTNTGIYGGDGTIPLNTTASVNGDLTFQGLDEDTRIILKDGNNGGEVHLFSDGSAGQSALEFYNPGGATLTSKIQNAGGDTRFISNNRDLLFTTNTGVTTEGIFIQAGTGNMGIGTTTPLVELHVKGDSSILRLETTSANNSNYVEFYDPSERKGWIGYPSSTSSTDALFIRNEEHGSKIIISTTDSGGTSRTAIDIDGNQNVDLPFGNLDVAGVVNIGTLGTGTSVNNLGIDASGNVVSGDTGGEVNTASNLGGGTGLFAQKSDTDLQFKSLTSTGGTVTITNNSTTVNIESAGGGTGVSDANKIFSWFMNVT